MSSYLITGSTRGLGLGLVQFLSSKPSSEVSHIFASGRKPSEGLTKLIEMNPDRIHFVELEVSNASSIRNAVKEVEEILSAHKAALDVLVNNAAIANFTPNGVETMSDLQETLNVNVIGMHLVTAGFLPLLRKGKGKKIANVQYANDLAKEEFSVFSYNPGWVKTDMGSEAADLSVEQAVACPWWENAPGLNQYAGGELPW
ncbi:dehydrogenase [Flagelloscypha sp. PMI_526]|nr:dehydrogenase [Flagelloscypha sp. PMI_526]